MMIARVNPVETCFNCPSDQTSSMCFNCRLSEQIRAVRSLIITVQISRREGSLIKSRSYDKDLTNEMKQRFIKRSVRSRPSIVIISPCHGRKSPSSFIKFVLRDRRTVRDHSPDSKCILHQIARRLILSTLDSFPLQLNA